MDRLSSFFVGQNFVPKIDHFVNNLPHYSLIFQILAVLRADYCIKQLQCVCREVFHMFLAILCFESSCVLYMGYTVCIVAIFKNILNGLIFRVLTASSSRALHNTTVMCL